MRMRIFTMAVLAAGIGFASARGASSQHADHAKESDRPANVDKRGDHVMGFDHEKTTHHFRLAKHGGSIEVTANSSDDTESREAIRGHLSHIARMFSEGNFEAPMLIHDQVPPGVPVMKKKKESIQWKYEELPEGARVVATTKDKEALAAIHEFLKFQIEDHRTGDPLEVGR
jgi:hypothetical protein